MAMDPVCGMAIDPRTAEFRIKDRGQTYYFCSKSCKTAFSRNPLSYTKKKGMFTRFLNWIVRANEKKFEGAPPSCCGHK